MDDLSAMQVIALPANMPEDQKVALLMNLYHLLCLHGIQVIGPASSRVNWPQFFCSVAYLFNFHVLSLYELEHVVLRYTLD